MADNNKIVEKVCKCLRLSESCNANEAAAALRQAQALMKKYNISDEQILAVDIQESSIHAGERYNPPTWAMSLANIVARTFQCRSLVFRRYGHRPNIRFVGMGDRAEIATYTFTVLYRKLEQAQEEFRIGFNDSVNDEYHHKVDVFTQGWLFRVGRTVSEFAETAKDKKAIDDYIKQKYGETMEVKNESSSAENEDFDAILSGMKAADEVMLYRSIDSYSFAPTLLQYSISRKRA